MMLLTTVYIFSMRHFVVSISSHPKTLLLKRPTLSTPMFSGTWTRLYQKEAITFPQGQYFFFLIGFFFLIAALALQ